MKEFVSTIIVFAVFLTLIPCLAFLSKNKAQAEATSDYSDQTVKIYFTKEEKCESYSLEEYIIGAVLSQMPATFEEEALKAQCVLAHTYELYRTKSEQNSTTQNLHGAIMSDDESIYQGFFTKKQAEDFYGDKYNDAYEKVKKACGEVINFTLCYKDEPVIVAFHAISSGSTESSQNAWGQDIPYLQAKDSSWDKDIDGVKSTTEITSEHLRESIEDTFGVNFNGNDDPSEWLEITDKTQTGYVTSLSVCTTKVDVSEFTTLFSIASPCFEISYADDTFTFTSMGYGHLVGVSQYGANYMATQGKTYKQILEYYYTDCSVEDCRSRN